MKTCLIIPYFGKLPAWFRFFLKSCEYNIEYDFYIITDDDNSFSLPKNVKIINYSFASYLKHLNNSLDLNIPSMSYYKLTDFKPFLYFAHQDIVKSYDYWGFCDLDLVFGNLESFFQKYKNQKYIAITTHRDRFAGHFSIFLVDKYESTLSPKRIKHWKVKLASTNHYGLDEMDFSFINFRVYRLLGNRIGRRVLTLLERSVISKVLYGKGIHVKEYFTTPLTAIRWWDKRSIENQPTAWIWQQGSVYSKTENVEVPYLHFMNFKKSGWNIVDPLWGKSTKYTYKSNVSCFEINENGIFSISEPHEISGS